MSNPQVDAAVGVIGVAAAVSGNPNIVLAWQVIGALQAAIQTAHAAGTDITDAQLSLLFSIDDMAKAADLAARQGKQTRV